MLVALGSCSWEPKVRPIEARRIATGSYFVLQHEPIDGLDYVTVVEDLPDGITEATPAEIRVLVGAAPRSILDVATGETCATVPGKRRRGAEQAGR